MKKIPALCASLFLVLTVFCSHALVGYAQAYINPETGYKALVEDDAELLSESERLALQDLLEEITVYGNVTFKTIDDNSMSTEGYARSYYKNQFGTAAGTLFLIDMDNRKIWIHSDGAVYKIITTAYANTVTDNVYQYASDKEYFICAKKAFEQILSLLRGQRIAQPMKYISNGLLAVILALLLNYGIVSLFAGAKKPGTKKMMENVPVQFSYTKPLAVFTHQTRTYNPVSSDSGSSSSSGGGGGSSSGSSGGGGGHSF